MGNVILTEVLPDAQSSVLGGPFVLGTDEKLHFIAPCTTAWRCTVPPDAGRVPGEAVISRM